MTKESHPILCSIDGCEEEATHLVMMGAYRGVYMCTEHTEETGKLTKLIEDRQKGDVK